MNELQRMKKLAGILTEGVMAVPGIGSESDMQTAGNVGRGADDAAFDAAQPSVDEAREPNYHSVFALGKDGVWGHYFDADDAEDARSETDSLKRQGEKTKVILVPKSKANWQNIDVDAFVKGVLAKKAGMEEGMQQPLSPRDADRLRKQSDDAKWKRHREDDERNKQNKPAPSEMEEAYDFQNGYNDRHEIHASNYFPDGADSPVVATTGAAGARQGDNPEQKKMAVAETHKELVYNYRKFLKESTGKK